MSTFFRGITGTVRSLFHGTFPEQNSVPISVPIPGVLFLYDCYSRVVQGIIIPGDTRNVTPLGLLLHKCTRHFSIPSDTGSVTPLELLLQKLSDTQTLFSTIYRADSDSDQSNFYSSVICLTLCINIGFAPMRGIYLH
jgi:hypothetical protein